MKKREKNNAEGNDKKRNGVALVIVTVIAIIFIPIAFLAGKLFSENGALIKLPGVNVTKNFEVTSVFLKELVEPASDLVTTRYRYKRTTNFSNPLTINDLKLEFIKDEYEYVFSGTIYVGVDLSKVKYRVDEDEKMILVTMPKPYIIAHDVDNSSFEEIKSSNSIFVDTTPEDYAKFMEDLEAQAEDEVLNDNEFMDEVNENAENVIAQFLTSSQYTCDYTVEFK